MIGSGFEAVVGRPARSGGRDDADGRDRERLERELAAAQGLLASSQARLANPAFTSKAPPAVVDGARSRHAELAEQVRRLEERLRA